MPSYAEFPTSPQEEGGREGIFVTRRYLALRPDRFTAMWEMLDLSSALAESGDPQYADFVIASSHVWQLDADPSDADTARLGRELRIEDIKTTDNGTLSHAPDAGSISGSVTLSGDDDLAMDLSEDGEGNLSFSGTLTVDGNPVAIDGSGTIDYQNGDYTLAWGEDGTLASVTFLYTSGGLVDIHCRLELQPTESSAPSLPAVASGIVSYRCAPAGEYAFVPGGAHIWQSSAVIPLSPDSLPTLRVPITQHVVTWHGAAAPSWDAIRNCLGCVNDASFLGADGQTLLFDGCQAEPEFAGIDNGDNLLWAWRLTFTFREMAIKANGSTYGWNHRYRPLPTNNPGWDKPVDQHGNLLYRTANFETMFA